VYFWRGKGHRKVRIRERQNTAEFHAAYQAALVASEKSSENQPDELKLLTYRWLCEQFFRSTDFKQLDQKRSTRVGKFCSTRGMSQLLPEAARLLRTFPPAA
jgi:hypothetical protein